MAVLSQLGVSDGSLVFDLAPSQFQSFAVLHWPHMQRNDVLRDHDVRQLKHTQDRGIAMSGSTLTRVLGRRQILLINYDGEIQHASCRSFTGRILVNDFLALQAKVRRRSFEARTRLEEILPKMMC